MKDVCHYILVLILISFNGKAQIHILNNYSSGNGSLTLFEINDFIVINNFNNDIPIHLDLRISNKNSGEDVFFETAEIILAKGSNSILGTNFNKQYFNGQVSQKFKVENILRNGEFNICISITSSWIETPIKQCDIISLKNERIIHLLSPFDRSVIETANPYLQWMSSYEQGTTYYIKLVPLFPFKSPEEALSKNVPYLEMKLKELNCLYPFNLPVLEFEKYYAWQVYVISEELNVIDYSEAWIFSLTERKNQLKSESDCYRLIHKKLNNGNYIFGDFLKFGYDNVTHEKKLSYKIKDLTTGIELLELPEIVLQSGLNKIDVHIKKISGIHKDHRYVLEVNNNANEKYRLSFMPVKEVR